MQFELSYAEYSVVNAIRGLTPRAVAMLMGAKTTGKRTWVIDVEPDALTSLKATLDRELAAEACSSTAAEILPRVAAKVEQIIHPRAG